MIEKDEEFVPVAEPVKKRKPRRRNPKRATKKDNGNGGLKLTELELVHMELTERDHQLSIAHLELANSKLTNLTLEFHRKQSMLKQNIEDAKRKTEQAAKVKNTRMAEIDQRLRGIDPNFNFSTYIIKDDGTLVPESDVIGSKEPVEELPSA